MKVSKMLMWGFTIVILFSIIVGIIGIAGMYELRSANISMYNQQVHGLEHIGRATAAFKQMRIECRAVVTCGLYDDAKGAADAKARFEESAEDFVYWIDQSNAVSTDSELTRFYERIEEILENEYMPKATFLIETSINDIPDHAYKLYINALLASLVKTGGSMERIIIGTMDYNTALAAQTIDRNGGYTNFLIWTLSFVLCAAVVLAIVIALYITRSISQPIHEAEGVLSRIAEGDFEARLTGKFSGEFAAIMLAINSTAGRLSDYMKERIQKEKARELAAVFAIADAGILIKDKNGLIIEWNAGAERILGYSRGEIIGKMTKHFSLEEEHGRIDALQEQLKQNIHTAIYEDVRVHKDGRLIDCLASLTPLFTDDGEFDGSLIVFHDATEKKLADQKSKRLAAIVSIADAAIVVKDKFGIVTEWNIGAESILGYKAEEVIGQTTHFYAPQEYRAEIDEISERLAAGEHIDHIEVARKRKDGRLVVCSASHTPILDDNGSFMGSVTIFHDISEKKHMESQLKQTLLETEAKHQTIMSSIEYARKIQRSLLPANAVLERAFSDFSVLWKPRDTVGGDIYWCKSFNRGTVLCACDCTGHGTPGALLTMLVVSAFESIVNEENANDPSPNYLGA